jgi:hypothetical protein
MPGGALEEVMMKTLIVAALAATMLTGVAQARTICLRTQDMMQTQPADDGGSITFKMRDGSVWRNDLHGRCPDLRYDGFIWDVRDATESVCEDIQPLRVLRSGQICMLGKFTKVQPSRAEQHAQR